MADQEAAPAVAETPKPVVPQVMEQPERPRDADGRYLSKDKPIDRTARFRDGFKKYIEEQQATRLSTLTGTPVAEKEAPAVTQEQPKAELEEPETPEAAEPEEDVDVDAVAQGVESLRRIGMTSTMLEKFSKSELAAYGAKAAQQIAANAEASRELGESRKAQERAQAASAKVEQPAFDIDAFKKRLEPVLDEEAVVALTEMDKAYRSEIEKLKAENKATRDFISETLRPIHEERIAAAVEKARAGLAESFPQLKGGVPNAVLKRMQTLNRPDEKGQRPYSDANELLRDACRYEYGREAAQPKPSPKPRPVATPLSSSTARPRTRPATIREVARIAYANRGLSTQEIQAKVRGAAS